MTSERRIQESRYLVSLINPRAKDAAIICSTIEIIRATRRTMAEWDYCTKIGVIILWRNGTTAQRRNGSTVQRCNGTTVQRCTGSTVPRAPLTPAQRYNGTTVQRYNGTTVQRYSRCTLHLCTFFLPLSPYYIYALFL